MLNDLLKRNHYMYLHVHVMFYSECYLGGSVLQISPAVGHQLSPLLPVFGLQSLAGYPSGFNLCYRGGCDRTTGDPYQHSYSVSGNGIGFFCTGELNFNIEIIINERIIFMQYSLPQVHLLKTGDKEIRFHFLRKFNVSNCMQIY